MKTFFKYFLIIIISLSIEAPSCVSIFDIDNETSLIFDLEEEVEDSENINDIELKFASLHNPFCNYVYQQDKAEFIFIYKEYNSILQKLDSPPPEIKA